MRNIWIRLAQDRMSWHKKEEVYTQQCSGWKQAVDGDDVEWLSVLQPASPNVTQNGKGIFILLSRNLLNVMRKAVLTLSCTNE